MSKLGFAHPQVLELTTTVVQVVTVPGAGSRIRLGEVVFRHACGGQPADQGWLAWDGGIVKIDDVIRSDGQTWLISDDAPAELAGQLVVATIDAGRRHLLSRCHSLTHVLGGCLRRNLPDFASQGAEITEDGSGATLRFNASSCADEAFATAIAEARAAIARGARVEVVKAKSLANAAVRFAEFRVDPGLALSGRIRVVDIAGIDSNPCSGSHVNDIAEIGAFTADHPMRQDEGYEMEMQLIRTICL